MKNTHFALLLTFWVRSIAKKRARLALDAYPELDAIADRNSIAATLTCNYEENDGAPLARLHGLPRADHEMDRERDCCLSSGREMATLPVVCVRELDMSRESSDVSQIRVCNTYSLGFANRLTDLTARSSGIPKQRIGDLIHEMLRECAARQNEDSYHPIQAIRRVSDEIAQTVSERDPGRLISYIDKLPEPDRTIIGLRMAGLSYRETAERLGLNQHQVLDVLSMRMAAMASIDAGAQPIRRTGERSKVDE